MLNSDYSGCNDLILIEPDSKKYFLLTQLLFCKQPLLKPNQGSPSEVLIRTQLLHSPKRWDTSAIQSWQCPWLCKHRKIEIFHPTPGMGKRSRRNNGSVKCLQFSSVAQLCPTLCDPMDCSMPGFPVHHQLPEPTQIHVHQVGDAVQPSVIPFSFHLLSFPASGPFQMSQFFASGGQSIGVSVSASVLPMNI